MNQYHVYIMTNKPGTLYTGITNNLEKRVYEHRIETLRFAQGDRYGVWLYILVW